MTRSPRRHSVIVKARVYERGFPWFILDLFTRPMITTIRIGHLR